MAFLQASGRQEQGVSRTVDRKLEVKCGSDLVIGSISRKFVKDDSLLPQHFFLFARSPGCEPTNDTQGVLRGKRDDGKVRAGESVTSTGTLLLLYLGSSYMLKGIPRSRKRSGRCTYPLVVGTQILETNM